MRYSPYLSPGSRFNIDETSFARFPPTYMTAGDAEMLLDEIIFLHGRMREQSDSGEVVLDIIVSSGNLSVPKLKRVFLANAGHKIG